MPLSSVESLSLDVLTSQMGNELSPSNELIIPTVKFRHVTKSQALRCQQAQPGCDLFEKVQEGICCFGRTRPRCQGQHQGQAGAASRVCARARLAPPRLLVSRLNQLRHKYFSISHHSDFSSSNIILSLDT